TIQPLRKLHPFNTSRSTATVDSRNRGRLRLRRGCREAIRPQAVNGLDLVQPDRLLAARSKGFGGSCYRIAGSKGVGPAFPTSYCPTPLASDIDDAAIAGGAAEDDAALFLVPHHRGDGALAGAAQQHFLGIGEARRDHHAVLI